jgi:hypothetical protein
VDQDQAEALQLTFEKDALLIEYQTRANRWNALQAAALAVVGFAVVGFLEGVLPLEHLLVLACLAGAFLHAASRVLKAYDRTFNERIQASIDRIGRLKEARRP